MLDRDAEAFAAEFTALCKKYDCQIVPFYQDGALRIETHPNPFEICEVQRGGYALELMWVKPR